MSLPNVIVWPSSEYSCFAECIQAAIASSRTVLISTGSVISLESAIHVSKRESVSICGETAGIGKEKAYLELSLKNLLQRWSCSILLFNKNML